VKLEELGERGAIEVLKRIFDRGYPPGLGIGDDCALIDWGEHYLLVTTDAVSQRAHIPPSATPYQIGWYVVVINLSDVAAMGGYPLGFVAALVLPRSLDLNFLRELARGMDDATKEFGLAVLGGDTKEGNEIMLSGTAFGRVRKDRVLLRTGARPGDVLVVTGDLGRSGWGARALRAGTDVAHATELMMRPHPRVEEGKLFSDSGAVTSCMDVSDGLGTTLAQMSSLGHATFEVDWGKLPVYRETRQLPLPEAQELALYWGGDYELVATVRTEKAEELVALFREKRHALTVCGRVLPAGPNVLVVDGKRETLHPHGWEHFRSAPLRP
jgi:thiamine-monophosphate kinase